MKQHRFIREDGGWYIDLPDYLQQGGSKGDLAMVAGADTMLDILAGNANTKRVTSQSHIFCFTSLLTDRIM